MWTRNYSALDRSEARVCFGVETSVSRCGQGTMAPWAETTQRREKEEETRREEVGEKKDKRVRRENGQKEEERRKERGRDGKRLKESRERESEARLEWRRGAESGNWRKKDDERRSVRSAGYKVSPVPASDEVYCHMFFDLVAVRCVPSSEKCWMQVSPVPASDEMCPT
ncbi:hypothetical protein TNCV_926761 [Trichonephila clavipes]|nr:hypothetical protein TNCV_926761 [Trichonephila clavipes]